LQLLQGKFRVWRILVVVFEEAIGCFLLLFFSFVELCVLATAVFDHILLGFVCLLNLNLLVSISHQLLRNLIVVYDFARVRLTVLSLNLAKVLIVEPPCALMDRLWVNFRDIRLVKQ
jgi:hypothetical protein